MKHGNNWNIADGNGKVQFPLKIFLLIPFKPMIPKQNLGGEEEDTGTTTTEDAISAITDVVPYSVLTVVEYVTLLADMPAATTEGEGNICEEATNALAVATLRRNKLAIIAEGTFNSRHWLIIIIVFCEGVKFD